MRRYAPAGVVELVDTPALGAGGASRGGSSPSARTPRFVATAPLVTRLQGGGWVSSDGDTSAGTAEETSVSAACAARAAGRSGTARSPARSCAGDAASSARGRCTSTGAPAAIAGTWTPAPRPERSFVRSGESRDIAHRRSGGSVIRPAFPG